MNVLNGKVMEKKIGRSLVKMAHTKSNGEWDFDWYNTMMGKQAQLIDLYKERLKIVGETLEVVKETNNTLRVHRDMLQREIDINENKVIIFQPWNIGKKKKKNVED
jgi:hypothetical protein